MTLKQWWCGWALRDRAHGSLRMHHDALWTHCWRCGYVSPGIRLDTRWVTIAWRYAQHRMRFKKAS